MIWNKRATKRAILSTIAKIYDACGFLAPIIIEAKIIMQELWKRKVDWDESLKELHSNLQSRWENYYNSLPKLNELRIDGITRTKTQ